MRKTTWFVALTCALASLTAAAQSTATPAEKGKTVVSSNGARLGIVYRVSPDGSAQIIIDGKLVTIPVSTLSSVDGKLTTSLSKSEVLALR